MAEILKSALRSAGFTWSDDVLNLVVSHLRQEEIREPQALVGEPRAFHRKLHGCLHVPMPSGCEISDFEHHAQWPLDVQAFMKKIMKVRLHAFLLQRYATAPSGRIPSQKQEGASTRTTGEDSPKRRKGSKALAGRHQQETNSGAGGPEVGAHASLARVFVQLLLHSAKRSRGTPT